MKMRVDQITRLPASTFHLSVSLSSRMSDTHYESQKSKSSMKINEKRF